MARASAPQAFYCLWQNDTIREKLFEELSKEDICNVRVASSACCNLVTKRLFLRTHLTFSANTFTRQSRIQALSRIGHHIEHLTFYLPHSDATFLPPLVHPETGREISFLYTPHTSMASVLARPKFSNTELGDILTQQYPPMFHAASNVPSFINAMKHLPNMRHLTIKTPGQNAKERYRRDIVDYALISLRISLERAPLKKLTKLSLSSVHPSAFIYLRHVPGFGCMPSAGRRWQQIRKLNISVESWDFYGPSPGLDHLKVIDDYIRTFSTCLEKFTFAWLGRKGPCPVSLAADPLFAPPRSSRKLFNEVTSPMSPLPPAPSRKPIMFRKLKYLSVRNATMNAPQVAELVADHQHCVREFDFENVILINNGSWDEALAPLMNNPSRSDHWSRHSTGSISEVGSVRPVHYSPSQEDALPSSPSAAVEVASQELFELDIINGEEYDEGYGEDSFAVGTTEPRYEDVEELASDLEAARQASLCPSTKMKKRRITKRRRKRRHHSRDADDEREHEQRHEKCQESQMGTINKTKTGMMSMMDISAPILDTKPSMPIIVLQPAVYDPTAELCSEITAVQRDIEAEEKQRMLAEDVAMRTSALKKAKEAVLSKLSEQFHGAKKMSKGFGNNSTNNKTNHHHGKDMTNAVSAGMAMRMRFHEGLFGRSNTPVVSTGTMQTSMDVPILFSPA
ncbi:uncharacterized protein BCR38DRAFT_334589 [Pseudomassariella vexata]|uniref:Uncharacterized protein n=1 Tax=Pseudomassariella vexata TaxID=1141098 RepID=A0A1Y2EAU6_9PEZI|nr:uncharacterized protein BCR38DRAFT_334589 [Pseudomassariella vexata]ORY68681.1 hypothetical protein BCR38DRAFT_334589 [Pseudomassariella vexata]